MKNAQKKVGRPPMLTGKRTRIIKSKLTEDEYKALLEIQKTCILNRMELIRRRVLGKSITVTINTAELLNALDTIGSEMGRAGNNINQLARHANVIIKQGRLNEQTIKDFNGLFSDFIHFQQELQKLLRYILRTIKYR